MDTRKDILEKLILLSKKTINRQHRILLNDIRAVTDLPITSLMLRLSELQLNGFIKIHETDVFSINLTKQGMREE